MTPSTMPIRIRTLRETDYAAGGRSGEVSTGEALPCTDPFAQTRRHFARLTGLSVAAFLLLSAVSALAS